MSAAVKRSTQFEGLAERRDVDEIIFSYRALLNYILFLEDKINDRRDVPPIE
jgi:hypothetical protein